MVQSVQNNSGVNVNINNGGGSAGSAGAPPAGGPPAGAPDANQPAAAASAQIGAAPAGAVTGLLTSPLPGAPALPLPTMPLPTIVTPGAAGAMETAGWAPSTPGNAPSAPGRSPLPAGPNQANPATNPANARQPGQGATRSAPAIAPSIPDRPIPDVTSGSLSQDTADANPSGANPSGPRRAGPNQAGPNQTGVASNAPLGANAGLGTFAPTNNQAPPPAGEIFMTPGDAISAAMARSLGGLMPPLPNAAVMLAFVADKVGEMGAAIAEGRITVGFTNRRTLLGREEDETETSIDEQHEADDKSWFDDVVGVLKSKVVTIALDVLMVIATIYGGPLGTMAVIGLSASISGQFDSGLQAVTGHGLAGWACRAKGEDAANRADMAFQLGLAGVALVCSLNPKGAAQSAGTMQDAAQAADTAKTIETFHRIEHAARTWGSVVTVASDGYQGVENYQADHHRAAGLEAQAKAKTYAAESDQLAANTDRDIDTAFQLAQAGLDCMEAVMDALREQAGALVHAKMTA